MDKVLVEMSKTLPAYSVFDMVRRNYTKANKNYLQKQISIAAEYLTEDQKSELRENGYVV